MDKIFEFAFENDLYDCKKTYEEFICLYNTLACGSNIFFKINMKKVKFISANLFSIFGCILDKAILENKHKIEIINISKNIRNLMQRNGFNKFLPWNDMEDFYHNCIPYISFKATTEQLEQFEKYLLINVFDRPNMPIMSDKVKDSIIDNILEMFNNVIDHANCEYAYVCGQYFVKKNELTLTIVDLGQTIKDNVNRYMEQQKESKPRNCLEWAMKSGNSTKSEDAPGGLGFNILLEFLKKNKGRFSLVSSSECFATSPKGSKFYKLDDEFKGTIVTITFNLNDDFLYLLGENIIKINL